MPLNILCVGDVVGRPGRVILSQHLGELKRRYDIGCTIVNAENAAGGTGLTAALFKKFMNYGVDLICMGDHVYKRIEIAEVLESSDRICRPANLPAEAVGKQVVYHTTDAGVRVALFSVLGRTFMRMHSDNPFGAADRMLEQIPRDVKVVVCDVHAEATSEKVAMGWHLDGRTSVVFGTHTHIPTADETILPGGAAYITDLGMTGPYDSVLGRRKDRVLRFLRTAMPSPFDVAVGDPRLCGIVVSVDTDTGRATHIERICIRGEALESAEE